MTTDRAPKEARDQKNRRQEAQSPDEAFQIEAAAPLHPDHAAILKLQRTIGNQAVQRLVAQGSLTPRGTHVQTKPAVAETEEDQEQEVEAAETVMRVAAAPPAVNNPGQPEPPSESPEQKIRRIINDRDDDGIVALKNEEIAVATPDQRAGMIRILTDLTWTSYDEERATVQLLQSGSRTAEVVAQIDAIGYRQRVIDSVDNDELHKRLLELLGQTPVGTNDVNDPIAAAIASGDSQAVMAITDFTRATNAQRLGLLQILLDMSFSNEEEERKILDILESTSLGGLSALMSSIKGLGLKQSLFDHIDDDANKQRLTGLLSLLNDPELNADLQVFNRGFFGNLWEGVKGGFKSAVNNFSIGHILMGMLQPIIHPIDTIVGLINQAVNFLEAPSWDGFLTFMRDFTGTVAMWLLALAGIAAAIGLAVAAGIVTIPASIAIEAIAASLLAMSGYSGIAFLVFAGLRFLLDLGQAGAATTARELEREQAQIGEDLTLAAVILAFIGIFKGIGKVVESFRAGAVEPSKATPEALKETADQAKAETQKGQQETTDLQSKTGTDQGGSQPNPEVPKTEPGSEPLVEPPRNEAVKPAEEPVRPGEEPVRPGPEGKLRQPGEGIDVKAKWGDPKSTKAYGHSMSEHGAQRPPQQLIDRAQGTGKPQGQWADNSFIVEAEQRAPLQPGEHVVDMGRPVGRVYMPDGKVIEGTQTVKVIRKADLTVRTSYPIASGG